MVLHHIPPPTPPPPKISGLSLPFSFCVITTPSFHFVSKTFLEMELGEALNDKEIYLKNDRGAQLTLWPSRAWYATVIPEKWPRDATDTKPFSEKWPRDATCKPRVHAFWDIVPFRLVKVYHRFRWFWCRRNQVCLHQVRVLRDSDLDECKGG